jgi:hypothetical protein
MTQFPTFTPSMRKRAKEILASKEASLAFLVRAGIATPSGRLTKRYKVSAQ